MATRSKRAMDRQAKDRDRQARRRAGMKASGKPTTHTIHSALVAGIRRALGHAVAERHIPAEVRSFLEDCGTGAIEILVERKGYDREAAVAAVLAQIRPSADDRRRG